MFFNIPFISAKSSFAAPVTIPDAVFLHKRYYTNYQDTTRLVASGTGNVVKSATDGAASPHHMQNSGTNVPTLDANGGLVFDGTSNRQLVSSLTVLQPLCCLIRCTFPVSQNSFVICDTAGADLTKLRFNGTNLEVRDSANTNISFPLWAPDSTPRVLGMYITGAGSYVYINGTYHSFDSYSYSFTNGIRLGTYTSSATVYDVNSTITDIGIWQGTFTTAQIDLMAALLNS